jgi:hypothetical protein
MPVASAIFQYGAAECWNRASAARITLLCLRLQGFPGPAMFQPVDVIGSKTLLSPKWKDREGKNRGSEESRNRVFGEARPRGKANRQTKRMGAIH